MKKRYSKEQVYACIVESYEATGWPPSIRQIQTALGISSESIVHHYITQLSTLGMVETRAGLSGIRPTGYTVVRMNLVRIEAKDDKDH